MITEIHIPLFTPAVEMNILDIIFRLLCALIVGIVIGTEREYTHRPAGMRTHMLVALGACVVMVIGQLIFEQYQSYGATPDPARMAAQVITPIVAGTLLRNVGYWTLFPYAALFVALSGVTMLFVRHGDSRLITKKGLEAFDTED